MHLIKLVWGVISLLTTMQLIASSPIEERVARHIQQADSLQNLAGDYQAAIHLLEQTLQAAAKESASPTSLSDIHHKLGVNYFYTDQFDQAVGHASRAIRLRQQQLGEADEKTQNSLFLRAAIYRWTGQYEIAARDIASIISALKSNNELSPAVRDSLLAIRYEEIAANYLNLGDYPLAHSYLEQAENLYIQQYGAGHYYYFQALGQQAIALEGMGKYEAAIQQYQQVLEGYRVLGPPPLDYAIIYTNFGLACVKTGQYRKAAGYTEKARAIYQQEGEPTLLAEAYANLSGIYTHLQQYDKAIKYYKAGTALAANIYNTHHNPLSGELYTNHGELLLLQSRYEKALTFFQKAIMAYLPEFEPRQPIENPVIEGAAIQSKFELLRPLQGKARAHRQQFEQNGDVNNLRAALQTFQVLDTLIINIRRGYPVKASKFLLIKHTRPIYEEALQTALSLFEETGNSHFLQLAYNFSARNKAIVLIEGLQHELAKSFANIPPYILKEEKQLKWQVYQMESKVNEMRQQDEPELERAYQDSFFHTRQRYMQFIQQIERDYPGYYLLKYAFANLPNPKTIKESLSEGTLMVEFFLGSREIYIFAINADDFTYYRIPKPPEFEATVVSFQQMCAAGSAANRFSRRQSAGDAYLLYQWLLSHTMEEFKPEHLLLIPDGLLAQLAFEALLTEPASGTSQPMPYLLQDCTVSYLYSSQFLPTQDRISTAGSLFAGFGIEYDPFTLAAIKEIGIILDDNVGNKRSGGQLIHSDDEVTKIAAMLSGEAWLNRQATKRAFLDNAGNFRLLHLAMHGMLDRQQPLNSALIFTKTNDTTDFLLRAADLYNLPLNAEMVVLSACNTGAGQIRHGEGVRTLARAFRYAGANSIVASLWSAPDKATKEIMVYFYQHLQKGLSREVALQKAKQDYLAAASPEFSKPSYWSHLILVGDTGPIAMQRSHQSQLWGLILIAGLVILLLILILLKRR